jgi:glycerate 2-kinase
VALVNAAFAPFVRSLLRSESNVPDLPALHLAAREIFAEALERVDSREAVRRAVRLEGSRLKIVNTTLDLMNNQAGVYAIAIGKAARPMASALSEILGERLTAGIITAPPTKYPQTSEGTADESAAATFIDDSFSGCWRVFEGGHPLPNRQSLEAARAAFALLHRANLERGIVIFLISGGGSALMEWPRDERTTLEDLRKMNEALVSCGADIEEINAVRRAVSQVKGGGLARRAPNCAQVSLIVSDTSAGREAIVASGPTFEPPMDAPEPASIIARYQLEAIIPEALLRSIQHPTENTTLISEHSLREHYVLLDNEHALACAAEAARSRGFTVEIARDVVEQPIREGCSLLLSRLFDLSHRATTPRRGVCLISGGEFKCPVRGSGMGGRNTESALRWAIELDTSVKDKAGSLHVVALSAGTDGIDGNSPAAGAISDETTIERARELQLDAHLFLEESNAYTFFHSLNDAIITNPTGTNVRDLRIMLAT